MDKPKYPKKDKTIYILNKIETNGSNKEIIINNITKTSKISIISC